MTDLENEFDKEIDLDAAFDAEESVVSDDEKRAVAQDNFDKFQEQGTYEDPNQMGKLEAATMGADPLFLNPLVAGASAVAGDLSGRPDASGVISQQESRIENARGRDLGVPKNAEALQKQLDALRMMQGEADKPLGESFYPGIESQKQREEKAFEDQPASYITGGFVGGAMGTVPAGMLAKGSKLAKVLPNAQEVGKIAALGKRAKKAEKLGEVLKAKKLLEQQAKLGLKLATREGAKAGAFVAAGRGDSRLLEGDVGGFIQETLTGGAAGAALGAGFDKALKISGSLLSNSGYANQLKKVFSEGAAGKRVDKDFVQGELVDTTKKYIKEFQKRLGKTGANIGKLYEEVSTPGEVIDTAEFVKRLRSINEFASQNDKAAINKILNVLDDFSLGGREDLRMVERLEKKLLDKKLASSSAVEKARIKQAEKELIDAIETQRAPVSQDDLGVVSSKDIMPGDGPNVEAQVSQRIFEQPADVGVEHVSKFGAERVKNFKPSKIQQSVDPQTGREYAYSVDKASGEINRVVGEIKQEVVSELSPSDLHKMAVKLGNVNLKNVDPNVANDVRDVVKSIRSKLKTTIKDPSKRAELEDLNKTYSNLKRIEGRIGLDYSDPVKVQQSVEKVILGVGDKGDKFAYTDFISKLKKVDSKLAKEIQEEIASIRFRSDISKVKEDYINSMSPQAKMGPTQAIMALLGKLPAVINKGVNALGRAAGDTKNLVGKGIQSSKTSLANRTLNITQTSPEQIQRIIQKIEVGKNTAAKHFLGPLKKAIESTNNRKQQSIMYGLSQQSAFIDILNSISEEDK